MDRIEAGGQRRQHVVVDAVADIGDVAGDGAGLRDDALKERRVGLGHVPARGRADEVGLEIERTDEVFAGGAGVARDPDAIAWRAQASVGNASG
jgi:hypothetical protein